MLPWQNLVRHLSWITLLKKASYHAYCCPHPSGWWMNRIIIAASAISSSPLPGQKTQYLSHDQTWASEVKLLPTQEWLPAGTKGKNKTNRSAGLSWKGSCLPERVDTAIKSVLLLSEISPWYVSWWYSFRKVTDGWLDWMTAVDITRHDKEKNNPVFTGRG